MNITELFENSLKYPAGNWVKVIILGVLLLIPSIFAILLGVSAIFRQPILTAVLGVIFVILLIVLTFIIYGYSLSVTRETISRSDDLPEFQWMKNFIDGIKYFIVHIVYYIIPVAITLLVAYLTGFFEQFATLWNYVLQSFTAASQNATITATNATMIPPQLIADLQTSAIIVAVVAIILFIIFSLLLMIAIAKLAETNSLGAAVSLGDVFQDIGKIGWGKYIVWFILLYVIIFIIQAIVGALGSVPLLGFIIGIISVLVITPYLTIFSSRALGLIYNESKE
ncbi:DUF4013 domain-containing protein [Methanobrevibacter sp. TMH8]|uniref:DUF4013 domain-containing protein n=1 Tax=Methanobrevibacter sp. TMH8 TaxID=2848611 RepID=UPI001CCE947B|nr:DUF4013 domain-containing protein [Methanobrevibacter sp. TMH8]MBZ9570280.1 DUF4013 domain-containing protein [Methanobrevibacter sp. TMH8]